MPKDKISADELQNLVVTKGIHKKENGSYKFVASTSTPDRSGDIIDQEGWDLSEYKNHSVVFWMHSMWDLPIGKADARLEEGKLVADITFSKKNQRAQEIEDLVEEEILNAVSVGFKIIEAVWRDELPEDHPYYGKRGRWIKKARLFEISIVTLGDNQEALRAKSLSLKKEADLEEKIEKISETLDQIKKALQINEESSQEPQEDDDSDTKLLLQKLLKTLEKEV